MDLGVWKLFVNDSHVESYTCVADMQKMQNSRPRGLIYFYNPICSPPTPGDGEQTSEGWRTKAANMFYGRVKKKRKTQSKPMEIYTVDVELEFPKYLPDHQIQVSTNSRQLH